MNKHEQLIRSIAEEMATIDNKELFKYRPVFTDVDASFNQQEREYMISLYLASAQIAVKHMAEEFKAGYNDVYDFTQDPVFGPHMIKNMIERGLIPSPENDEEEETEVCKACGREITEKIAENYEGYCTDCF